MQYAGNAFQKGFQPSKHKQQTSVYYICFNTEKYDTFVFKTAKYDTWSIFFDQVSYFFHKKIDQVSLLVVFFDQVSYSTYSRIRRKGFRRKVVHRYCLCILFQVRPFVHPLQKLSDSFEIS